MQYEVQVSTNNDRVWIHFCDGSTVGRFSITGIDLHNSITEQLAGAPQCRLCTHGKVSESDWELFREKAKEWWNVDVPKQAFNIKHLSTKNNKSF